MIEKAITNTCREYSLIPKGSIVTVALSGGADSVALLYALNRLKDKLGITLKAAHLNHLIRGDEAFRDEEFVKNLCSSLSIPLTCEEIDVPKIAKELNFSLETAARKVRYEFLNRICEGGLIATAHTASDNLETVLLNLARGTALGGICGIPIRRDNIVRPIISVTREEIEKYCEEHNLSFVTDSTNLSDDYTRNKIRHNVVPILKEINPKIEKSVLKTARSVTQISNLIKDEAENYIKKNLSDNKLALSNFNKLNPEIAKRVITQFVKICDSSISLEACHIESIYDICLKGGKTGIPKNRYCQNKNGCLMVGSNDENLKKTEFFVEIIKKTENVNNLLLNNALDCDKIVGKLVLRTRISGDSIRLANRGCTKTLRKLYNECKIPVDIRDTLPVIADDLGVVWIHTIGVAKRCEVSKKTNSAYIIGVKENE